MRRRIAFAEQRQRGAEQYGEKSQSVNAEQRRALQHAQRGAPTIAREVPGKAREDISAQPFSDGVARRKEKYPRRSFAPSIGIGRAGQRDEQRQSAGKNQRDERQLPGMRRGVHHESVADPVEAGEELAEAEGPADRRALPDGPRIGLRPIEQQQQRAIGEQQQRNQSEGCKGQRGQGSRREGESEAPPAAQLADEGTRPIANGRD